MPLFPCSGVVGECHQNGLLKVEPIPNLGCAGPRLNIHSSRLISSYGSQSLARCYNYSRLGLISEMPLAKILSLNAIQFTTLFLEAATARCAIIIPLQRANFLA